jgi:biotin carboxyl carrier protein
MENNGETGLLNIDCTWYKTRISKKFKNRVPYQHTDPFLVVSVIPGSVLDIPVKVGQVVKKGDDLVILDSMKMQNKLKCLYQGKVKKILVKKGDKVPKGTVLLELE